MQDVTLPLAGWFASAAPALAAVAAVFIAGALAFFAAVWRDRRRELNDLMIAARAIASEMDGAKTAILQAIENDGLDPPHAVPSIASFPATWEQHRGVLARHLTREQWDILDLAVQGLEYTVYLPAPAADPDTTFANIADALDSASTVLEAYAGEAGWWDSPGRKQKVPQIPTVAGVPTAAASSPAAATPPVAETPPALATPPIAATPPAAATQPAAAASVDTEPPIAAMTEPFPDTSPDTVPPYLLGMGAAAVLSVVLVGVLVAERHTAAPDTLRAVGRRAQETAITTTDRLRNNGASWQQRWRNRGEPSGRRRLPSVGTWPPSIKGLVPRGR